MFLSTALSESAAFSAGVRHLGAMRLIFARGTTTAGIPAARQAGDRAGQRQWTVGGADHDPWRGPNLKIAAELGRSVPARPAMTLSTGASPLAGGTRNRATG